MTDFNWLSAVSDKVTHHNIHVVSSALVLTLFACVAWMIHGRYKRPESQVIPSDALSLPNIMESAVESLSSLVEGIIGPSGRQYLPLLVSIFFYIFVSNLLGVLPGFLPPTDNINTNLAVALVVFVYYNALGIKRQGFKQYMQHFMGPIWWLAPLMLVIELIGHLVRPLSLSMRLFGNITGDHVVLGIFSELVPLLVPVIFLGLGIFVSFIQAFVFTLLSTIYIALAVAQEEHH